MANQDELSPNIVDESGTLLSGIICGWTPTSVGKSLAEHLLNKIETNLEEKGDWLFIEDLVRSERLTGMQHINLSITSINHTISVPNMFPES